MVAKMPNFLKINSIGQGKNKEEWVIVKVRINPYTIHCYREHFIPNFGGQDIKKIVAIFVASEVFYVDMTIEEADEMMESIDRSVKFDEQD